MEVDNSNDICVEALDLPFYYSGTILSSKLQSLISAWLKTFVIKKSSGNKEEWHFRTLFVAEITILPLLLSFIFLFWWVVNRNVRFRKTKGSLIPLKEEPEEDVDNFDEEYHSNSRDLKSSTANAKRSTRQRKTIREALLQAYTVELDEDESDNETLISVESYFEESDCEESIPTKNLGIPKDGVAPTDMFLSKEKLKFWKVLKDIPIFSFFDEEAMEICMNGVEYIDLSLKNDFLWKEGQFDGSLFYVLEGAVIVKFLDFVGAPSAERGVRSKAIEVANVLHVQNTVVTSQLALIEGMVRHYLGQISGSISNVDFALKKTTAQITLDKTQLLRIPPSCFSQILDRFPETMLRIIQTTLNRAQRVSIQTLVRCCGLRQELLVSRNKESKIRTTKNAFSHIDTLQDDEKKASLTDACATLATILNIEDLGTIEVLEETCSLIQIDSNDTLIKAGSNHDSSYLLLRGVLEMGIYMPLGGSSSKQLQNDANAWYFQRVEAIHPGSILGGSALFTTDINLFEIRYNPIPEKCKDCAILLRIPRDVYAQLVVKHPRAMATSLVPVLAVLSPVVFFLTWTTEWIHVEAAGKIVEQGTPCKSLFVVLNGRLRATNRVEVCHQVISAGSSKVIPPEEYGRGKIFGQVESLANVNWPFDVIAIRQSELARVPITTIEVVIQNFPHAGLRLARVVASDIESLYFSKRQFLERMPGKVPKHVNDSSGSLPFHLPSYGLKLATIAVVPLSQNIDLKRFCRTLYQAMETIAPCKLLTKTVVKSELGDKVYQNRNALHDLKMTRLLADFEENNRVVIYQADKKFTFWTRLCILQADCILLVVDSQVSRKTTRVEETIEWAHKAMNVRVDLVVVGTKMDEISQADEDGKYNDDDGVRVSDQLNNWSETRNFIAGHHLVRAPFERYKIDFHRMCRRISGKAVGLVLGAGGARGIAHLGVIRALKEAGVTVDMVGGTSQGAFCGALFAKYPDDYDKVYDAFNDMSRDMSSTKERLRDLTLPIASIFAGRNFNKSIKRILGNERIQDLLLNFFCVSVDLQNQNLCIHTKGKLWKFVRASMGLTGYLPPIAENGSLLVDGGYLNSLPTDVMKYQMGAGTVIAVDVSTECKREYYEYGTHLSGWWILWNSFNPFCKTVQIPSMSDVSDMLIWINSEQHRKSVRIVSDLHLTPPVQDVGTLEYDKFDEIVNTSYRYAQPLIADWVEANPWLISTPKISE